MSFRLLLTAICLCAVLLTACGDTGADNQTLDAHETEIGGRFDALHTTATAGSERLLATIEAAETSLARVLDIRGVMLSTLEARGIDINNLPAAQTAAPTFASASAAAQPPANVTPTLIAPVVTPAGAVPGPTLTPSSTALSTQAANLPTLSDLVISFDIDQNDCASSPTRQFSVSAPRIYVVARARNITAGTTIRSRWTFGAQELASFSFAPDFNIDDACIWFFADQTDFVFAPGDYAVTLEIDGVLTTPPITYNILDPIGAADDAGDAMQESP